MKRKPDNGHEKNICFRCRHFYVTWDKKFPRGCKAMGFVSRDMPSLVVRDASAMKCLKFKEKKRNRFQTC